MNFIALTLMITIYSESYNVYMSRGEHCKYSYYSIRQSSVQNSTRVRQREMEMNACNKKIRSESIFYGFDYYDYLLCTFDGWFRVFAAVLILPNKHNNATQHTLQSKSYTIVQHARKQLDEAVLIL